MGVLIQLEPDVDREHQQDDRDQERNTPAPLGKVFRVHVAATKRNQDERQQQPECGGGLNVAGSVAALVRPGMLCDIRCCPTVLAAERKALQQAKRDEQDWREPADASEGWEHADQEGGAAHDHDGDKERVFAADQVADTSEDHRAERANEEAGGISGKGRQERCRVVTSGEEQGCEERCQHSV